jgi:hypothetical protein
MEKVYPVDELNTENNLFAIFTLFFQKIVQQKFASQTEASLCLRKMMVVK